MKYLDDLVKNSCILCPRECKIDRNLHNGLCKTRNKLEIASYNLHFGEEPPISGKNGSGAIFFAGCNLSCVYCQNYPISQLKSAYRTVSTKELADIMIKLQKRGAHNINLVTPSHFVHLICESIDLAKGKGLKIPIVYNTSSYEREDVIYCLKDYVDIYLADLKYSDNNLSKRFSGVSNYTETAEKAISAMFETKGRLIVDKHGIAEKGVIIRHLVLPNHIDNTKNVLKWVQLNFPSAHLSLMSQYFPVYKAEKFNDIKSKLSRKEWSAVLEMLDNLPDTDGFIQDFY